MEVIMDYSRTELERAEAYAHKVGDILKPLSVKEKWLVINTLRDAFPIEELVRK